MPTSTPPTDTKRILIVEDDQTMAQSLVQGIKDDGFDVTLCNDGTQASEAMQKEAYDLVVLDLMLPGKSGETLLAEWQSRHTTPVIVLTARSELTDRLKCFELGAVDYLPKPFWMQELLARIRTRLRVQQEQPSRHFSWADVVVDLDARQVNRHDEQLDLTRTELNVLMYLIEREGRAMARAQIADDVLTVAGEPASPRTVDGYIARLRQKLGDDAGQAIQTVWGIGYRFQPET
jgi:DNA-binding response OmpR family regulator